MSTITKRDGKYRVRYTDPTGKERQKSFTLKKDAEAYRQKVEREIHAGLHTPDAPLFRDLASAYLSDCERRWGIRDRMAGNTYHLAVTLVNKHLVPEFGAMKADEISPQGMRDFVNMKSTAYKRITIHKLVKALRDVLQLGVDTGALKRNIVRDQPPRIPNPPAEQIEIPSLEQLRALLVAVENRERRFRHRQDDAEITRFMVYAAITGAIRRGEVVGLRWENVDLIGGVMRIRHSVSRYDGLKEPKSRAGNRDVPLTPILRQALGDLWARQGHPTEGPVIPTKSGGHMHAQDLAQKYWDPLAKELGLLKATGRPFGLHSLRHGAASLWIMGGMPAMHLKKVIGHASVNFTMDTYGHLFSEDETARRVVDASAAGLRAPVIQALPSA